MIASYLVCTNVLTKELITGQSSQSADMFPKSFTVSGEMASPAGAQGDAMFRVDGYNNILSHSITYFNASAQTNVTETVAYDYSFNMTYTQSTYLDQCSGSRIGNPAVQDLIAFITDQWANHMDLISSKWQGWTLYSEPEHCKPRARPDKLRKERFYNNLNKPLMINSV